MSFGVLKNPNPLHSFPDHPDIERAMRVGYPIGECSDELLLMCERCGCDLDDEPQYADADYNCLCAKCLCELHERR